MTKDMSACNGDKFASADPEGVHPFGGCNRMRGQYATIGAELLTYEHSRRRRYWGNDDAAVSAFREGVVFVPLEVLESYLDDLLDLEVTERRLYIERRHSGLKFILIALAGICVALAFGLEAAASGASLLLSFGLTVCLALPFGLLWHYAPRHHVARRMSFAQVLSHEISRRRGDDRSGLENIRPQFGLRQLLERQPSGSTLGAARELFLH